MKTKSRLAILLSISLTVGLNSLLLAQTPLAVGGLGGNGGQVGEELQEGEAGILTNFILQFVLNLSPSYVDNPQAYSTTFYFTTNEAGRMFTINPTSDTNFNTLVSLLTNGTVEQLGSYCYFLTNEQDGSGFSAFLPNFFILPAGNNGIDFEGFQINGLSILIDKFSVLYAEPGPGAPSGFTSVDWAARLFVNGDPLLVSTNISETIEVGDNVSFSAFTASSHPLNWEWSLNGSNPVAAGVNSLDSGTNYLNLVDTQVTNNGAYTLIVSNNLGSLTSAVMRLNVIPRVQRKPVPAIKLKTQSGSVWTVVYADSLAPAADWLPLAAATVTNSLQYYFDTSPTVPDYRFYKAIQSGTVATSATLDMQIATEVTLTGKAGDTLLVEAINPIGPTNAWESVGTVTLTNPAQPYFDTSTIGQPPRLYRLTVLP